MKLEKTISLGVLVIVAINIMCTASGHLLLKLAANTDPQQSLAELVFNVRSLAGLALLLAQ